MTKKVLLKCIPYILLMPMICILGLLVLYPVFHTILYSMENMKLTSPDQAAFIGIENYRQIVKSSGFWYSLQNTAVILLIVTVLTVVCGMITSLLLNGDTKISGFLTAAAILPWALPPVVNGMLWKFIFHPGFGLLNKLLLAWNIIEQPILWLSDRLLLLVIISIASAFRNIPFFAIVLLAAMKAVPVEIYEAARMDGCNLSKIYFKITLPVVLPFVGISVSYTAINAVNIFDEIIALSGFSDLGKNLLIEDYLITFSFLDFGKGSALTCLIMILSLIFGSLYLKSINRDTDK